MTILNLITDHLVAIHRLDPREADEIINDNAEFIENRIANGERDVTKLVSIIYRPDRRGYL